MIVCRQSYGFPSREAMNRRFERKQAAKRLLAYVVLLPIIVALAIPTVICNQLVVWFRLLREW